MVFLSAVKGKHGRLWPCSSLRAITQADHVLPLAHGHLTQVPQVSLLLPFWGRKPQRLQPQPTASVSVLPLAPATQRTASDKANCSPRPALEGASEEASQERFLTLSQLAASEKPQGVVIIEQGGLQSSSGE